MKHILLFQNIINELQKYHVDKYNKLVKSISRNFSRKFWIKNNLYLYKNLPIMATIWFVGMIFTNPSISGMTKLFKGPIQTHYYYVCLSHSSFKAFFHLHQSLAFRVPEPYLWRKLHEIKILILNKPDKNI